MKKQYRFGDFIYLLIPILFFLLFKSSNNILFALAYSIFFFEFVYVLNNFKYNLALFAFLSGFFIFLLASDLIQLLFNIKSTLEVSRESINHSYFSIVLSLIFVFVGYLLFKKNTESENKKHKFKKNTHIYIRQASLIIFYITFVAMLISIFDNVLFVYKNGYVEQYLLYSPGIPTIIVKIGDMCPIAFFTYLSTRPSIKQSKKNIFLYLSASILTIFTGKRFEIVATLMIIIIYYFVRNEDDQKVVWITKKQIFAYIAFIPILIIFLQIFGFIRSEQSINIQSPMNYIIDFFNSVGNSNRVIKWGYEYLDKLPKGKIYSFGTVIDYFKYGKIAEFLGFYTPIIGQNAEYAINGTSYAHAITFTIAPSLYLSGHGFGSSYIAELYHDFGYFGLSFFSIILGIVISLINKFDFNKPYITAISMELLAIIIRIPRDSYGSILAIIINYKYWFCIFIIAVLANFFKWKENGYMPLSYRNEKQ